MTAVCQTIGIARECCILISEVKKNCFWKLPIFFTEKWRIKRETWKADTVRDMIGITLAYWDSIRLNLPLGDDREGEERL